MCVRHGIGSSKRSRRLPECRDRMAWLVGDCTSGKQKLVDEEALEVSYSCRYSIEGSQQSQQEVDNRVPTYGRASRASASSLSWLSMNLTVSA